MVNFDRRFSAFASRVRAVVTATTPRLRAGTTKVREVVTPTVRTVNNAVSPTVKVISDAMRPKVKIVSDALSPRVKVVTDVLGPKVKMVGDAIAPRLRSLNTASPKVKAICAGGALAVVAGIAAPLAVTASGHDAYAADAVTAVAADGTTTTIPHADQAKKAVKAAAAKAPTVKELHPTGIQGYQSDFALTTDQMRNAQQIIQAGQAMGLPPRAWVIAVATSMQETKLHNYGDLGWANDHDSLGLFQQRPSSGWGSPQQLQNPTYAAKAFYKALTHVHNWDKMNLTDVAQAVQVSAFGDRYAQWEAHAGDVVDAFYGHGPLAQLANKVM